jgi:hypothetical protein
MDTIAATTVFILVTSTLPKMEKGKYLKICVNFTTLRYIWYSVARETK